jgi:hypothetical protein
MRKQIHKPTILQLCVGIVAMTCLLAAAANAQPSFAGKFTLPYEVHWGHAVLPPGDYLIRMNSIDAIAVISSKDGSMSAFTGVPTIADSNEPDCRLTITSSGDERKVRTLNLPEVKKVVIFAPLTRQEKEALAKAGSIKDVPVVSAKR